MNTLENVVREIKTKGAALMAPGLGSPTLGLVVVLLLAPTFGALPVPNGSINAAIAGPAGKKGNDRLPGTEEFGLSKRELVKSIEAVEQLISKCMREAGFEYIAASSRTVLKGMNADKSLPGMSETGFIARYGFGISTLYTGKAPQLADGYSPAKVGLGKQNIRIYQNLTPADQGAYNYTLFGENTEVSFAVALEIEDLSRCGGCTRKAIEQVFAPEHLKSTYYNPKNMLINKDPRMVKALKKIAQAFRDAGYDYTHTDDVEPDIRRRLYEITGGGSVSIEQLAPDAQAALKKLQAYERAVAVLTHELESKLYDPVEARIERELYARRPQ